MYDVEGLYVTGGARDDDRPLERGGHEHRELVGARCGNAVGHEQLGR